ncbi:MAG TPA: hypothetical protein EYG17_03895 [Acidimicrobiia bacterium]|jgi:hypothetical protein|nr:hypothetical protein [Acidimicrobiia bacterium]HIL05175.1 hypothetical protein [Acidimicrobiia bacterium]
MVTTDLDAAAEEWRTQGWTVVHDLVPAAEIDQAVNELWKHFPTPAAYHSGNPEALAYFENESTDSRYKPASQGASHGMSRKGDEGSNFRLRQFLGHVLFPYDTHRLNRLQIHPRVVEFAKRAMGADDIRLYQARIWGKYTGVTNYEQPFHQDRNHNIVPDRLEPDWWNLEGFLYLSDVEDGVGPTEVLSLGDAPPGLNPQAAAGRRGSYLAYRSDVWHRGVNLTRHEGSRFLMNIAFKHAHHEWIGFDSFQQNSNRGPWSKFAASCTPEELALFGAPRPGHPYWTSELVDALEVRYQGIDARPWREALDK